MSFCHVGSQSTPNAVGRKDVNRVSHAFKRNKKNEKEKKSKKKGSERGRLKDTQVDQLKNRNP